MSDFRWYIERAHELISGMGFQESGYPTAYWPVGWPALIGVFLFLCESVPIAVASLNLIGFSLIIYCIIGFGREICENELVARVALLIYCVYPNHIAYIGVAATETIYTAIVMTAFLLLIKFRSEYKGLILCGVLFGLATLVKPQTLAFPFGAVIALVLVFRKFYWRSAIFTGAIVYIFLFITITPWSIRNFIIFNDFVLVSTNGGTALILGANDDMTGRHFGYEETNSFKKLGIPWKERIKRQVELNKKQKEEAVRWIRQNLTEYIKWMPKKFFFLWYKDTDGFWSYQYSYPQYEKRILWAQIINQTYYMLIVILSAICAVVSLKAIIIRNFRYAPLGLLFCMPAFVSILAIVFTGQIRYHFPAIPFLVIASVWSLMHLKFLKKYCD